MGEFWWCFVLTSQVGKFLNQRCLKPVDTYIFMCIILEIFKWMPEEQATEVAYSYVWNILKTTIHTINTI